MSFALARTGLVALGLSSVWAGVVVVRWPGVVVADTSAPSRHILLVELSSPPTSDSLGLLVAKDPFRLARTPATTPYDPLRDGPDAVPDQPPPPKPVLLLSGILWGREPSALLEGIPGIEGPRVVHPGDTLGGLTIRRIREQSVEVRGFDTTWTLLVRESWR
jgi:hypothetical protein